MSCDYSRALIHGSTIASLLRSVTESKCDCDGLLLGDIRPVTKKEYKDDTDPVVVTELEVHVTGVLSTATTCSFYNAAGEVQEHELLPLKPPQDSGKILGWISFRCSSIPLQPSMREAAVCTSMWKHMNQQRLLASEHLPVLMLLMNCGVDHGGATHNIQYRLFQYMHTRPHPHCIPLPLSTLSLSHQTRQHAYSETRGIIPAPDLPISYQPPHSHGPQDAQHGMLSQLAASAQQQVQVVDSYYDGLVSQLAVLCCEAAEGVGAVRKLQEENEALMKQLMSS